MDRGWQSTKRALPETTGTNSKAYDLTTKFKDIMNFDVYRCVSWNSSCNTGRQPCCKWPKPWSVLLNVRVNYWIVKLFLWISDFWLILDGLDLTNSKRFMFKAPCACANRWHEWWRGEQCARVETSVAVVSWFYRVQVKSFWKDFG